jgi:hypothetical protein
MLWLCALCMLCGCATGPQFTPIRTGETVALVFVPSPPGDGVVRIHNQALGNDMSAGAGSGILVGGLWGLTCGPLAVLCVPLGAATGALTGTAAGAAAGVTGALSDEKAALLRDRLSRVRASHDLLDELRTNVTDRARGHWNLTADASKFIVTVELQDLLLTSTRDERIGLIVRVRVNVQPSAARQPVTPKQTLYEYVGPLSSLAVWLDERSDFLDTSLRSASQQIAAQFVSELAVK